MAAEFSRQNEMYAACGESLAASHTPHSHQRVPSPDSFGFDFE